MRSQVRALPRIARVGFAAAVAYRAEILVWVLAYTMPLIMMALWTAVAREAPIGRFGPDEVCAYFMAMLVVRLATNAWIVWEMNWEVRTGTFSQRLLRPVNPIVAYAAEMLAALPMRMVIVGPIAALSLLWLGLDSLSHDAAQLLLFPATLAGAWLLFFLCQAAIGILSFWWESSLQAYDLWLGCYMVLSGYVMPLEFFPEGVRGVLRWLPFHAILGVPVEAVLGLSSRAQTLRGLGVQAAWVAVMVVVVGLLWRRGVRRYQAFGG